MPDGRWRGVEVGGLESSRRGRPNPSGDFINLGLLFEPAPLVQGEGGGGGVLSSSAPRLLGSGFLDLLLIRLLVKKQLFHPKRLMRHTS